MLPVSAGAAGSVSIEVSPTPAQVYAGDTVTVTFTVKNNSGKGIGALDFTVSAPAGFESVTYTAAAVSGGVASYTDHFGFYSTDVGTTGFTSTSWLALTVTAKVGSSVTPGEKTFTASVSNVGAGDNASVQLPHSAAYTGKVKVIHRDSEHTWDNGSDTKAATCTAAGVRTYTCTGCGQTKTESIAALGHAWGDTATFQWSGDYASATATLTCTRDNQHTRSVDATVKKTAETAATCTEAGSVTYTATASYEGKSYTATKTVTVQASGHDAGKMVVTKKATCTAAGEQVLQCTKCGTALGEPETIPMTNHTYNGEENCTVCGKAGMQGDPTGDGKIDLRDVTVLFQHAQKLEEPVPIHKAIGDMNGDGLVDESDTVELFDRVLHGQKK